MKKYFCSGLEQQQNIDLKGVWFYLPAQCSCFFKNVNSYFNNSETFKKYLLFLHFLKYSHQPRFVTNPTSN